MGNIVTERYISDYLEKHWRECFPMFKLLSVNPSVYGCLSQHRIGAADFLFSRGKKHYIAELKYSENDSIDLWDSFKAIGYAKAHELQSGHKTIPVIILRKELINNDIRTILYKVGLDYITISRDNEGYLFEYDFR